MTFGQVIASPCVLCGGPFYRTAPVPRPTAAHEARPDATLCVSCWRQAGVDAILIGWCETGRHHGHRSAPCLQHGARFI